MAHVSQKAWHLLAVAVVAVLVLVLAACKSGAKQETPVDKPDVTTPVGPPSQADERLASANNRFGFSLFAQLSAKQPKENVFISASSVAMALDMTLNGAAGETQQAMMKTLELQGTSPADVNAANLALRKSLANPDPEVKLSIANSLWLGKGMDFLRGFIDANTTSYGAKVSGIDFEAADAGKTINDWVKENTGGKIPSIVPDGPLPGLVCALVNAVYFVGRWSDVFDRAQTKDGPFNLLDGSQKKLPMMSQSGEYEYMKAEDFEAIRLPYGRKRMAMYIFLPGKQSSLQQFAAKLSAEQWEKWTSGFEESQGKITLPRFRAEYEVKLNDALSAMGMAVAFGPGKADFSKMCGQPGAVWIDEVRHKTFVEVDEEGTKAAAATSVGMAGAAAPRPVKPFDMVVDRPFFCAICDRDTNTILFMGAIVSPAQP
jgi:serpin B